MNDAERLTEIEIKIAYLEKSYADLSDVVRGVSDKIDLLLQAATRIQALEARLESSNAPPADDKPPHW